MNYACWRRSTLSHAIFNSIALTCRLDRITKVTAVPVMSLVNTCLSGFFQSSISRAVQIWDVSIFRMLWGFTNCPGSPLVISVLPGPVPTRSRALLATHIMVDKRIPNISDRSVIDQCGQYPVKKQQEPDVFDVFDVFCFLFTKRSTHPDMHEACVWSGSAWHEVEVRYSLVSVEPSAKRSGVQDQWTETWSISRFSWSISTEKPFQAFPNSNSNDNHIVNQFTTMSFCARASHAITWHWACYILLVRKWVQAWRNSSRRIDSGWIVVTEGWAAGWKLVPHRKVSQQSLLWPVEQIARSDQFWPVLTSFDQFWPVLTSFDQFWPVLTSFDQFWPVLTGFDQFHMLSLSCWYDLIWSQIYWSNTKATLYVISTSCMGLAMRLNIFNVCLLPTNKLIPAMLTCWLVRAVVHLEPSIDGSTHVDETFPENQKIKVAGVDAFQHVCNSMFLDEILMWNGEFGEKNELRNELWIVF